MDKNFLLKGETARKLFFDYADKAPIFDFHCHLNPKEIYENKSFKSITEAWLGGDHYKWRLMRSFGIEEKFITGDATDFEKFYSFANAVQSAPGNPVYHWAHLELQRYFDIYEPINEKNASLIFEKANEKLAQDDFKVRELIKKSNVEIIFTTDDPADTLEYHAKLRDDDSFPVKVLPAFRPDKALNIDLPGFREYITALSSAASIKISTYTDLLKALEQRIDFFDSHGCKASDHALAWVPFATASEKELSNIFSNALMGIPSTPLEAEKYKTALLQFFAAQYHKRGWVMELHMGVIRNNNTSMFEKMGPDTGYDAVADYPMAANLAKLLDSINLKGSLPKTVLFTINPKDNFVLGTLMGCFQSAGDVSLVQFGTAWWFNDHIDGMTQQMKDLGNLGVLGKFIGMLTDSRSFLSYPRHEYFRRILCNLIGGWIDNGEYLADIEFAGELISDICFNNAKKYFGQ